MKRIAFLILLLLASLHAAPTMSWISPYSAQAGRDMFSQYGKKGLSHIAMQFWVPNGGSVAKSKYYNQEDRFDDALIYEVRDTAHAYGIKAMLCVYNGDNGWNWSLAANSISSANRASFINALVTEMNNYGLDGIEIDLEGSNDWQGGWNDLYAFIQDLSDTLRQIDKALTIATFASAEGWHTPEASNWTTLAPYVDAITSMGYQETGISGSGDMSYSGQKSLAGQYSDQLMLGLPDHFSTWLGTTPSSAVEWAKNNGVGVAIWEMRLGEGYGTESLWRNDALWNAIAQIRGPLIKTYPTTVTVGVGGTVDPSGTVSIDSAGSKTFTITPDQWFVVDDVVVDGESKGAQTSFTLANVTGEHTIAVTFKKDPSAPELYTVATTANNNGTISPENSRTVESGSNLSVAVTPDGGYVVDYVTIDGINRGPVTSIDFKNLSADHAVEAFFAEATGGDLGKYEEWYSSIAVPNGDTIYYNDTLWMYQGSPTAGGWGSSMEPSISLADSYGTPPWLYVGLYNAVADSSVVSKVDFRSAADGSDTLIITTDSSSQGTVYATVIDTVILNSTAVENRTFRSSKGIFVSQKGLAFIPASAGTYSVKLYDLRGRELFSRQIAAKANVTTGTGLSESSFSQGIYLLRIVGTAGNSIQRLKF